MGRLSRFKSQAFGWQSFPLFEVIKSTRTEGSRWSGYFAYCPHGRLEPYHRETLRRLRELSDGLCVVIASRDHAIVADESLESADLLILKDLGGFDFSAYAIAISEVARRAPDSAILLMNDSVLGPFGDCRDAWESPWQMTGFTASSQFENHLQSYAFLLKGVDGATMRMLKPAIRRDKACDRYRDAVNLQETRLGRIASTTMTVGSLYYDPGGGNPVLDHAVDLCQSGFPFLKRSLLGRYASMQDEAAVDAIVHENGFAQAVGTISSAPSD